MAKNLFPVRHEEEDHVGHAYANDRPSCSVDIEQIIPVEEAECRTGTMARTGHACQCSPVGPFFHF